MIFGKKRRLIRWLNQLSCPAFCYDDDATLVVWNKHYETLISPEKHSVLADIYPTKSADLLLKQHHLKSEEPCHISLKTEEGLLDHTLTRIQYGSSTLTLAMVDPEFRSSNVDGVVENLDPEQILSSLPAKIYWEDRFGNILGCNKETLSIVRINDKRDVLHQNSLSLGKKIGLSNEDALKLRKNDLQVMQDNTAQTFEERIHLFGEERIYLSRKAPLIIDDKSIGILGVSIDITDRKKQQEELETAMLAMETAHREKSQFIANISHDLRTPLHTLLGTTELLLMQKHYSEQETHLNTMMECGHTLLRLIENVLNFSKLDDDTTSPEEVFNPKEMIESLVKTIKPIAVKKNLSLNVVIPDNTAPFIKANAHAISRIVINLLQNAIKFTDTGEVALSMEITPNADNKEAECLLIVRDTGVGIDDQAQEHVFKRFFQMNSSWKNQREKGGLGLGLAIVKKFTDLLGGTITLSSEPNVGTTFECRFPVTIADEAEESESNKQTLSLEDVHVLLVEDSPLVQRVSVHTLENFGCQVSLADEGEKAIRMAKQLPFDLIFLDMGLPDMTGLDVAKALKDVTIPIVALTAHDDKELRHACEEAGVVDYITKPASYKALLKAIEKHVKKGNETRRS